MSSIEEITCRHRKSEQFFDWVAIFFVMYQIPYKDLHHHLYLDDTKDPICEYFYDEENTLPIITISKFNKKYYKPFIEQILNHEI